MNIPHIGWNALTFRRTDCPILSGGGCREGDYVYFVHSFYGSDCEEAIAASTFYGVEIPAVVWRDPGVRMSVPPRKKRTVGLSILKAFCENG